jgi:hypothetical protein
MHEGTLQRWANLLYVLKYSVTFGLLLLYLPLTVLEKVPGFTLLGGLFLELTPWGLFWGAVGFFATGWVLMITSALLVDGADHDLPPWAPAFFGLPVERGPFLIFTLFGLWGCLWTGLSCPAGLPWRLLALTAGFLAAYVLLHLLTLPARFARPDFEILQGSWLGRRLDPLLEVRFLQRVFRGAYGALSRPVRGMHIRAALEPEGEAGGPRRLAPGHYFALTSLVGMVVLFFVVGWIYFPPRGIEPAPPAVLFLYILLVLLLWTINGLAHNLAPLHISPLVALLLIFLLVYLPQDVDHHYPVRRTAPETPPLTPVTVVAEGRRPETVVVIAGAGGGILAAGWLTLGLQRMIEDRPCLAEEIRLLSTVSGSSVGAAFYARSVQEDSDLVGMDPEKRTELLGGIYNDAVKSSLGSAAYGFAFLDFWRLFLGDALPPLERWDRGLLLANNWGRTAGAETLRLSALRPAIREGRLPAVIFASTQMETGRRLMITPLDFAPRHEAERAETLSEFLSPKGGATDLDLWSAARMSATFPYVSPAASARFEGAGEDIPEAEIQWRYHLIDGGYFDNFGVTSALDWLQPVLEARLRGEIPTRRIFLLRINPFAVPAKPTAPSKGAFAALVGPVLGVVGTTGGVAQSRNAIDLQRFLDTWNARFQDHGIEARIGTAEIRPDGTLPEPLSWHLTPSQIEAQKALWPESPNSTKAPSVTAGWNALKDFLADAPCPGT